MVTDAPNTETVSNIALNATTWASWLPENAHLAVDNDPETFWNAYQETSQSYLVILDRPYLVERIELLVTQLPAGATTHEIWLGDASFEMYRRLEEIYTYEGQLLTVAVEPAQIASRVLVRTTHSPSHVAWREVRVFGRPSSNQPVSTANRLKPFLPGGLEMPVQIGDPGDGSRRLFILEQKGRVRLVTPDAALQDAPFMDISSQVIWSDEQGLLGIAFPPGFAQKNYFYLSYTTSGSGQRKPGDLVISRFHLTDDRAAGDPTSEQIILVIPQSDPLHNGGRLAFGPLEGYLYIGAGDGGPALIPGDRSQEPSHLLGKMLRIDVESAAVPYSVPDSNPFVRDSGYRPEIWSLGLRNPWGFAFDQTTGDLYIADAGQVKWEEINFQPGSSTGGQNYGWPIMEGPHCFEGKICSKQGLTAPVADYYHGDGCAVVGGAARRGSFVYADFCTGRIWELERAGNGWRTNLLADPEFLISALGQDQQGIIYVLDYGNGAIYTLD